MLTEEEKTNNKKILKKRKGENWGTQYYYKYSFHRRKQE